MDSITKATIDYSYNLEGIKYDTRSYSNTVKTKILKPNLVVTRITKDNYYIPGKQIFNCLIINNIGNADVTNLVIIDELKNVNLVEGSIKYHSINQSNKDFSLQSNIDSNRLVIHCNKIKENSSVVINYSLEVATQTKNNLDLNLTYYSDDIKERTLKNTLQYGFVQIICEKKVSDDVTFINSKLSYNLLIKNIGNIPCFDLKVYDEIIKTFKLNDQNPIKAYINKNQIKVNHILNDDILTIYLDKILPNESILLEINGQIIE